MDGALYGTKLINIQAERLAKEAFHLGCPSLYRHIEHFLVKFNNEPTENIGINLQAYQQQKRMIQSFHQIKIAP